MEPSESKPNTKEVVEAKPVKEIVERAVSLETKASVKSAVDHLDTHGLEVAPVTDPEGTLVGKISKDRMIRGVSGRGHDPQTTPVEPEVEKEGEPYCYEHEPIAKAEEVMREVKVDAISVVSEEKKLIGKATRDGIKEERLKVESGKPRTDLKEPQQKKGHVELAELIQDIGTAIKRIDGRRLQAANVRTGVLYQPGIGPHPETRAVNLIVSELLQLSAARYQERLYVGVPYPVGRQKCDLCIGVSPNWEWAAEIKMLRLMGDNGKPNDNMLMHILSPYPTDRSALTDCRKLIESGLPGRKAVVIYGFDYPELPMEPAIEAFEVLARRWVALSARAVSAYQDLVHPVHRAGRVFGWEIGPTQEPGDFA